MDILIIGTSVLKTAHDRRGNNRRKGRENMPGSKYGEKKEKISDPAQEHACRFRVITEYSMQHPLEMIIYEKKGKQKRDVTIYRGRVTVDQVELGEKEALQYATVYQRDIERLLLESAKTYGEEKEVITDLHIAKLADKAGQAGTYAVVPFREKGRIRNLQIGRKDGLPVFRLDGQGTTGEEAGKFIKERYMEFLLGVQKAEAGLNGYHVEIKEEAVAGGSKEKPVFNLDDLLPNPRQVTKKKKDLHNIGDKYLLPISRSRLKGRG